MMLVNNKTSRERVLDPDYAKHGGIWLEYVSSFSDPALQAWTTLQPCNSCCFVPGFAQAHVSASGKMGLGTSPEPGTKCGVSQRRRRSSVGGSGGRTSKLEGRPVLLGSRLSERPSKLEGRHCRWPWQAMKGLGDSILGSTEARRSPKST